MSDAAVDFGQRLARVRRTTSQRIDLVGRGHREAFTAAAIRLDPARDDEMKATLAYQQPWQADAWEVYDAVPEVGRSADFMSDAMSRIRWYPGIRTEPDGPVQPLDAKGEDDEPLVTDAEAAEVSDAFARLGGASLQSIAGLFGDASLQIFVPGEGYVLGYRSEDDSEDFGPAATPEGEVWRVVAAERLEVSDRGRLRLKPWQPKNQSGGGAVVYSPQGGGVGKELPEDTYVFRFWQPHPRDGRLARSAVRRVLTECEELRIKLLAIRAQELQRMNGGIFIVKGNMANRALREAQGGPPLSPLAEQITMHAVTPIRDPGSAAAAAPFVLETDDPDGVKWLAAPQISRKDTDERDELSRRIVMGLPVPPENIIGLGQEANYANARIVTEQTFTMYAAPHADMLAEAFALGYLRRELEARGVANPERFAIGADPTDLIGKPGQEESVAEAHERLTVSDRFYRDSKGIPEEAAPDDDEVARRIAIAQGLKGTAASVPPEPDAESTDPNAEDVQPMAAAVIPLPARGKVASRKVAAIEAKLRTRVHAHLASLVERAVEKAGAKARTAARRDDLAASAISTVHNARVCAQLGPSMVAALGVDDEAALLEVLSAGQGPVTGWLAQAQDQALALAARLGDLPADDLEPIRARQSDDRDAGWALVLPALLLVARARLFDPDPAAPEVGEFDSSPLPMAPVAALLARAGGATGQVLTVPYAGARIPSAIETAEGAPEVGGATAGPSGRDAFRAAGFAKVSYVWEVGSPERPFEPHQNLDGLEFRSFFDERLANPGDWPPFPFFYAGDHAGCECQQTVLFEE